jgi:hypothetical protein
MRPCAKLAAMSESWGWAGTVQQFLSTPIPRIAEDLSGHHRRLLGQPPSGSQLQAWSAELETMATTFRACVDVEPAIVPTWAVVFEYELPLEGGRRPDVVVLAGGSVIVLEFKSHALPSVADVDQVNAYARDLADYHAGCRGRRVVPILVLQGSAPGFAREYDGTWLTSPEMLGRYAFAGATEGSIDVDDWLNAPYSPLPTLVEAARRIFRHEPLPHVTRAISLGIPETVDLLGQLVEQAEDRGGRVLAFVTGVPGAGKTLVGLRLVYERSGRDGRATFLSGNGPLVQVLQDALRSRVFVRDLHAYIKTYGMNDRRTPEEHVVVFDEAQRAWDADYMRLKRDVEGSEPALLLRVGHRIPEWAALVGLVGEGQEIHSGEEAGLEQWRAAASEAAGRSWMIHCPPRLAPQFAGLDVRTHDRLDLTASLRSRRAEELHRWVALLLEGSLPLAARLAVQIHTERFPMYLTRDLDEARQYVSSLYDGSPDATYGLVASSHAKVLPRFGVDNSYMATSRMNVAAWFNAPKGDPKSATALLQPVTEFGCQGLELDFPIVCWGEDYRMEAGAWRLTPVRRRIAQHDPDQLLKNAYRVLLTRGRDGFVVYLPEDQRLDASETALLAAGVRPMPTAAELAASG